MKKPSKSLSKNSPKAVEYFLSFREREADPDLASSRHQPRSHLTWWLSAAPLGVGKDMFRDLWGVILDDVCPDARELIISIIQDSNVALLNLKHEIPRIASLAQARLKIDDMPDKLENLTVFRIQEKQTLIERR